MYHYVFEIPLRIFIAILRVHVAKYSFQICLHYKYDYDENPLKCVGFFFVY